MKTSVKVFLASVLMVVLVIATAEFIVARQRNGLIVYTMYAGTEPVTGAGKVPIFVTIERQWNGVPTVVRRLDGVEIRITGGYMLIPANKEMLHAFHPELSDKAR